MGRDWEMTNLYVVFPLVGLGLLNTTTFSNSSHEEVFEIYLSK